MEVAGSARAKLKSLAMSKVMMMRNIIVECGCDKLVDGLEM